MGRAGRGGKAAGAACERPDSGRVYAPLYRAQEAAGILSYACPMRTLRLVIGALIALAGGVWLLQGVGILPGSFMSGDRTWAWIGGATLIVGLALLGWTLRRSRQ